MGGWFRLIYAMVLKNVVIDIKEGETEPYYPPDIDGNRVFAVETTEETEVGMYYHEETGKFNFEFPITVPEPTQLDNIETTQLMIMEAMADQYEQRLETDLMMMDAQATTFEAVLALTEGMV